MIHEKMTEIDAMVKEKEIEVVKLYAKQAGISIAVAKKMYISSRLRRIIRDKKTELYLESPYFILERYAGYMESRQIRIGVSHAQRSEPMHRREYGEIPENGMQHAKHSAPMKKELLNKKVMKQN